MLGQQWAECTAHRMGSHVCVCVVVAGLIPAPPSQKQYFNVPVSADVNNTSSPFNILQKIAQPGDFVVLKLVSRCMARLLRWWVKEGLLVGDPGWQCVLNTCTVSVQDIDNYDIENKLMAALRDNPDIAKLVDEFFYEHHVQFPEMLSFWGSSADPNATLWDSYQMFYGLRQKGIRAHSYV